MTMIIKATIFCVLFAFFFSACTSSSDCSLAVSAVARPEIFTDDQQYYKIYDVSIVNNGNCDTTGVLFLEVALDQDSTVAQYWNVLQEDATHFAYLNGIVSQGGVTVGIVVSYNISSSSQGSLAVNVLSAECQATNDFCASGVAVGTYPECSDLTCTGSPRVCISDGGLPRCIAEDSSSASSTAGSCLATISVVARANGGWADSVSTYQIYDVTVSNQGRCGIDDLQFDVTPQSGSIVYNTWNLDSNYDLTNYDILSPGTNLTSAGLIIRGGGSVSVTQGFISCLC